MLPNLASELLTLEQSHLHRHLKETAGPHDPTVIIDGNEVLLFCSNNYLGLANDPRLKDAACQAIRTHGVSAPASRLISGSTALHGDLESNLAAFLGTEAALAYPSGYSANIGTIPALVGPNDTVFSDALNHRSLIDACRLSRAQIVVYDHADSNDLADKISSASGAGRKLIVTDGVFSMDGDLAPLDRIAKIARDHNATLMVDDAHGTGVLGELGRGTPEHFGVSTDVDVWMISASKGLGTFGGAIAGTSALIEWLVNRSAAFIYTTALPPDICAATSRSLEIVRTELDLGHRLLELAGDIRAELRELGFDTGNSASHIIPVILGDANLTLQVAGFLLERGIFALGIRPPTVPEDMCRLRLSLMASHTDDHIERLMSAMGEVRSNFNIYKP